MTSDNAQRLAYWTAQMEEADSFMGQIMAYPLHECEEPMVSLVQAAEEAGVEVAFSERPHVHGLPRLFFLRAGLVPPWLAAAAELNARGWVLKMEDGYRTVEMQRGLGGQGSIFAAVLRKVQWECGGEQPPTDLLYRRLGALIANAPKVGTHMSGSAMDLSVLRRDNGEAVDRGAPYLELSELTPMGSPFVSPQALENREEITALMARHGFVTYPWEFWHYNSGDAYEGLLRQTGQPGRYGPVHMDATDGKVTPVENPTESLNPPEVIRELMARVLAGETQ